MVSSCETNVLYEHPEAAVATIRSNATPPIVGSCRVMSSTLYLPFSTKPWADLKVGPYMIGAGLLPPSAAASASTAAPAEPAKPSAEAAAPSTEATEPTSEWPDAAAPAADRPAPAARKSAGAPRATDEPICGDRR